MTKNFNLWCASDSVWIDEKYILKNTQKLDIQNFKNVFEKSEADPDQTFKDFAEKLYTLYGRLQNLSKQNGR